MQDRPDAAELVAAVAAFIEQELAPTLADPRLRFRALVAASVLGVVRRELEAGDAPLLAERARALALLGRDPAAPPAGDLRAELLALEREVAARIRAGEHDGGAAFDAAYAHAAATVVEKLRVASPRFLARARPGEA